LRQKKLSTPSKDNLIQPLWLKMQNRKQGTPGVFNLDSNVFQYLPRADQS